MREIACVFAANGAQAFRRDAPLADEEGNQHALRGLSDAPLAGGAGGAGWALVDDQGEGWKRKDRRSRRRPTVVHYSASRRPVPFGWLWHTDCDLCQADDYTIQSSHPNNTKIERLGIIPRIRTNIPIECERKFSVRFPVSLIRP